MTPHPPRPARWLAAGWRAWLYLLLGGALQVPAAAVLTALLWPVDELLSLALLWLACAVAAGLTALIPLVRALEATAAADLLGLRSAGGAAAPGLIGLTAVHLVLGATHSAVTLFLVGPTLWVAVTGRDSPWPGVGAWPAAAAAVLLWLVSLPVCRALMRALGRRILRPDPARRLEQLARRDTLARELHDSLGHALAVVSVQSSALQARLGNTADQLVRDHLAALGAASRQAQDELDQALGLLREGDDAGSPGLEAAAPWVHGPLSPGGSDRPVTLDTALDRAGLESLDPESSRAGYRILQEAVGNALRHATGPVAARLSQDGDRLVLQVRSGPPRTAVTGSGTSSGTAPGNSPEGVVGATRERAAAGSGLAGMRRRAALAGGALTVEEDPAGWTVRAELPA